MNIVSKKHATEQGKTQNHHAPVPITIKESQDGEPHQAGLQHKLKQHRHCWKKSSALSSPPPPTKTTTTTTLTSPHDYLLNMTKAKPRSSLDTDNYFHIVSAKDMEHYTHETIDAVRNSDMEKIRSMHQQGTSFQCSNAFGESLLHMACRHGCFEIVDFFIHEARVNIQCRDDVGRTPLHDACWSSEPNFQLIELIVSISPSLLLMKDKRGHAPLEYTRREHWSTWISFLDRHKDKLVEQLEQEESMEREPCQQDGKTGLSPGGKDEREREGDSNIS